MVVRVTCLPLYEKVIYDPKLQAEHTSKTVPSSFATLLFIDPPRFSLRGIFSAWELSSSITFAWPFNFLPVCIPLLWPSTTGVNVSRDSLLRLRRGCCRKLPPSSDSFRCRRRGLRDGYDWLRWTASGADIGSIWRTRDPCPLTVDQKGCTRFPIITGADHKNVVECLDRTS